jgi:hypothetical protein
VDKTSHLLENIKVAFYSRRRPSREVICMLLVWSWPLSLSNFLVSFLDSLFARRLEP